MKALAQAAKRASRALAVASTQTKDLALAEMAVALRAHAPQVLAANALDLAQAKQAGKNAAFLDRLALDPSRVEAMANTLEAVRALEDPVGAVTANWRRPNGLEVRKVRLPLGVVLMIYEARPNVTSDAAALCV
jgi:glutamate-5-semialdehyde dehydrogenase